MFQLWLLLQLLVRLPDWTEVKAMPRLFQAMNAAGDRNPEWKWHSQCLLLKPRNTLCLNQCSLGARNQTWISTFISSKFLLGNKVATLV